MIPHFFFGNESKQYCKRAVLIFGMPRKRNVVYLFRQRVVYFRNKRRRLTSIDHARSARRSINQLRETTRTTTSTKTTAQRKERLYEKKLNRKKTRNETAADTNNESVPDKSVIQSTMRE